MVHSQHVHRTDEPEILREGWAQLEPQNPIVSATETSAGVSTNRVYRLTLETGQSAFAKVSSYGSYVHFRQDHARIHQWTQLLQGTRYAEFLARVRTRGGEVFTHECDGEWVVFYDEAPRRGFLPRVLSEEQIDTLGREMALFHRASAVVAEQLSPTWQTLGSDVASLYDQMSNVTLCVSRGFSEEQARLVRRHCDEFLAEAERLGYHRLPKLPVLIDWNRGNFSVLHGEDSFTLFSRWDYDWFRMEPRMMDFYFFCRVVRAEGDQTVFSYTAAPLLEPRFQRFLRAYHSVYPLSASELFFLKEAYRFFILNYVLRTGEHFFAPEFWTRLSREAVNRYLPELESLDLSPLLDCLSV